MIKLKEQGWLVVIGCTLLSTLFFYLSTGLGSIWALAWVAPLPLLWLAYSKQPWWRIGLATFLAFGIGNSEFIRPFYGMGGATIGVTFGVLGLAATAVAAILLSRWVHKRSNWAGALLFFPALWTAAEYVTSLVSPNGTIGSFAYTQVGAPVLIQSAALFGIWSITFLICLVANGLALSLRDRERAKPLILVVTILFLSNLSFGIFRLNTSAGQSTARIAVIAKDFSVLRKSPGQTWTATTAEYAAEIHKVVAAHQGLAAVVLPEKLAILQPSWRATALTPLAKEARADHVRIIAGFDDEVPGATGHNIAITFEPDGTSQTYVKRHLVTAESSSDEGSLTPGSTAGLLGDGTAVEICKDMDFPDMIRSDVTGHGVGIVYAPAEDFTIDHWMHARVAVMRGVENGFSVVRSARKGEQTISNNRGQVLIRGMSSTAAFSSSVATVPVGNGNTLYGKVSDIFAWTSILLTVAILGFSIRPYQKTRTRK
ncbi:MAG TPA: hypothetical protein VLG92_04855 [Candidatus Saccharimonadia bacterium]|nr:hypothetical protein [Candidatus Saccharimonadia bacterium]